MNAFDLLDLILFLGIGQGIFLALLFQCIRNKNKFANRTLSIILLCASAMLFGRVFFFKSSGLLFFRAAILADIFVLLFGPLFYIYYRRLTSAENARFALPLYHFLPLLPFALYFIWTMTYSYEEFGTLYGTKMLYWMFFSIECVGISSCFLYGYQCYKILIQYKKEVQQHMTYAPNVISFLMTFLLTLGLFIFLWFVNFVFRYVFSVRLPYLNYDYLWVAICAIIFTVGYHGLLQPEILRMPLISKKNASNDTKRLKGSAIQTLKDKLEIAMNEDKLYRVNTLTLQELAKQLEDTTNNVSWMLNTQFNKTFYEYINEFRTQEFIERIQNGEHHYKTFLSIALEAGFNSKSTFNKAFKKIMNDTPRNYLKKVEI